jgi:transposase
MDGFCVRRPGVMWTGLWDLEARAPVAVVPGARRDEMERLLRRHAPPETVQAVVIDLSEASRQAVQLALPDAAIVADKFHVIALAGRALAEVRAGRRQRGNLPWLLHRGAERLSAEERERVGEALARAPALAEPWSLKEGLRSLYRIREEAQAAFALAGWLRDAEASGLAPFERAAATLRKWRTQMLNYWRYPLTNAVVEGEHNRVKVVKRRAYGYRNDNTVMPRILNLFHTD